MTEIENQIPFSGIDPKGRLKFGVLLEMFQEMADIDASKFNLSVRQTLEHDVTWVLRKYRIDLEKYPTKMDEKIRIKTYAEPYRNLYSLRSYKLWNGAGD
jgi:acyl-ACP thioesterase